MTVEEIYRTSLARLLPKYGEAEATAITREALSHFLGMTPVDIVLKGDFQPGASTTDLIDTAIKRVEDGEPIQYVTGESWFHGLKLNVTPDVLIPRKETSQLVDIIEQDWKGRENLNIIDICSGSGAIAIALSRALPFSTITGVEISEKAVAVARKNAKKLKCDIRWIEADILNPDFKLNGEYDIIVANPPYIPHKDLALVDENVLKYEPHEALFVPDQEPVIFYQVIAGLSESHLAAKGKIYFEINPDYANDIKTIMKNHGFTDVTIEKDFAGKNRFIIACR